MRGSAARALVPALAVLALVGAVAVAATGTTSTGTGDTRPPAAALLDTLLSLGLLAVAAGAALFVYGLTQRKLIAREIARQGRLRLMLPTLAVLLGLFALGVYYTLRDSQPVVPQDEISDPAFPDRAPGDAGADGGPETVYEPSFAWIPVAVVLTLALLAAAAYVLAERRRRTPARERAEPSLAEQLAAVLDDTLDDLRAETDPRRAVIAAYARFERTLAAHGLPRDPALTPAEYLGRALSRLAVDADAARRLTSLFAEAKFSLHEVDAGMKEAAIRALERVRDDLRRAATLGSPAGRARAEQAA